MLFRKNFRRKCSEKQTMRIHKKNAIIDRSFVKKIARNKRLELWFTNRWLKLWKNAAEKLENKLKEAQVEQSWQK
jgi:hypothetical protein